MAHSRSDESIRAEDDFSFSWISSLPIRDSCLGGRLRWHDERGEFSGANQRPGDGLTRVVMGKSPRFL